MSTHAMDRTDRRAPLISARSAGRVGCQSCGLVAAMGQQRCARCGAALRSRDEQTLQKVWAWWAAGLIAYVPANIFPMLRSTEFFRSTESTIGGGIVDLLHYGSYGIAGIVFFASIVIPVAKFLAIAYLAQILARPHEYDTELLHRIYVVVEFIGRWSMIDVFVVAILTALVQFEALATINPGVAAVSFAMSVIFTMLAAQSFDSRLIWDQLQKGASK